MLIVFCPFREVYSHTSSSKISLPPIFQLCTSHIPDHPDHCPQSMNLYIISYLAVSLSKQNKQPETVLKVLPTGRNSLHRYPSGMSQRGGVMLQLDGCASYHAEPSVNQAQLFSSPVNCSSGSPQVQAGREMAAQQE